MSVVFEVDEDGECKNCIEYESCKKWYDKSGDREYGMCGGCDHYQKDMGY